MGICCMTQGPQSGALWQSRRGGWEGRWEGGSGGRWHGSTYGGFLLMYDGKARNSVKRLSFNLKKEERMGRWPRFFTHRGGRGPRERALGQEFRVRGKCWFHSPLHLSGPPGSDHSSCSDPPLPPDCGKRGVSWIHFEDHSWQPF